MWILGLKGLTGKIISASQFACFQLFQSTRDLRCPKHFRIFGFSSTSIKLLPWRPIHTFWRECSNWFSPTHMYASSGFRRSIGTISPWKSKIAVFQ